MGTIRFGNDHFAEITTMIRKIIVPRQITLMICHVYYVEGLRHNLFLVGQFCEVDLKVAFRSNTCYVRNLEGEDLLTDDYSRYTWVFFLYSKDEAPDMIINFIIQIQRSLQLKVRSDNGTEFKNKKLRTFYAKLGITHNTSTVRTTQQNGVVEQRNHTLVEAARTMLIFLKTLEFLWAKVVATACFTHNCSLVHI
ncbi:retrovirus-related pol polyprotein from transposon TNT 1-94, partial [Tanacetum coccineum]